MPSGCAAQVIFCQRNANNAAKALAIRPRFLYNKGITRYEQQKKRGVEPVFHAASIGLNEDDLCYWKSDESEALEELAKM